MGLFESEFKKERKEFDALSLRNERRNLRYQKVRTGKSDIPRDKSRHALLSGKRISKNGKTYWEGRVNRSDAQGSNI